MQLTKKHRNLTLAVVVAAAVASGLCSIAWEPKPDSEAALRYSFVPGDVYRYSLQLTASEQLRLTGGSGAPVDNALSVDLDLELAVRASETDRAFTTLELTLGELRTWEQSLLGTPVVESASAVKPRLAEARASIRIDDSGRIREIGYPEAAPVFFRSLVQTVLGEIQIVLGDGPSWDTWEEAPGARFAARYVRRSEQGATPVALAKRFVGVEAVRTLPLQGKTASEVDGAAAIEVEPHAYLRSVRGERRLRVTDSSATELLSSVTKFTLVRRSVEHESRGTAAPAPGQLEVLSLSDAVKSPRAPEDALRRRAAGLTRAGLVEGVRTQAGQRGPDHAAWLWRATALLRTDDGMVEELERTFADPSLDARARALIIDLLASAGSTRAQAAIRGLIASVPDRQSFETGSLINHLALVTRPEPETIAFATAHYRASSGPMRWAAALVVGGLARQLARAGEAAAAVPLVSQLSDDLRQARAPAEREALLLALGNTAAPAAEAPLLAATRNPEANLRAAAASALRRLDSPASRQALFALAADADPGVQRQAIRVLGGYALTDAELARFETMVADGRIRDGSYGELLNVVSLLEHTHPERVLAIADELSRHPLYGQVSSRTRELQARARGDVLP